MPPKSKSASAALRLVQERVTGRATTRSAAAQSASTEVPSSSTPSVAHQLILPGPISPTTPGSATGSNVASAPTTTLVTDAGTAETGTDDGTTDAPAPPLRRRSIRKKGRGNLAEEVVVGTSSEPAKKKNRRGIVTGKATLKDIANNGGNRLPLKWNAARRKPALSKLLSTRLSKQIGSFVRSQVPMFKASYYEQGPDGLQIVIDQLSALYDIDWYKVGGGRLPIPEEFDHRHDQWMWLCDHFETDSMKASSALMTTIRASENKIPHRSGPIPFSLRGEELENAGHVAPLVQAWVDSYEKSCPERAERGRAAIDQAVHDFRATHSTPCDGPTTSAESVARPIPVDTQINVIESLVGRSAGTVVRGLGTQPVRESRPRGPAKGTSRPETAANAELLRQLEASREKERQYQEELQATREMARQADERSRQTELLVQQFMHQNPSATSGSADPPPPPPTGL